MGNGFGTPSPLIIFLTEAQRRTVTKTPLFCYRKRFSSVHQFQALRKTRTFAKRLRQTIIESFSRPVLLVRTWWVERPRLNLGIIKGANISQQEVQLGVGGHYVSDQWPPYTFRDSC